MLDVAKAGQKMAKAIKATQSYNVIQTALFFFFLGANGATLVLALEVLELLGRGGLDLL